MHSYNLFMWKGLKKKKKNMLGQNKLEDFMPHLTCLGKIHYRV